MLHLRKAAVVVALAASALAIGAGAASAHGPARGPFGLGHGHGFDLDAGAVFVQSDDVAGNTVTAYRRGRDGGLTPAGTYPTGGLGGHLDGAVVDDLASQGSLVHDAAHRLLLAVNAGSDTVSVFAEHGGHLALRQTIGSGGDFPVSIAVRGNVAYVLNARGGGSLQGYVIAADRLVPIPGSSRSLALTPDAGTPEFVATPGQVGFTPDGRRLVVSTKAGSHALDVFRVDPLGRLSATPTVTSLPGAVPFGFTFDRFGRLVLTEAGPNAVATLALRGDDTFQPVSSVATGQMATCWIAGDGSLFWAANAGSGSLSTIAVAPWGALGLLGTTPTDAGTVDATTSPDGRFLYVQTGAAGIVDAFRIGSGGSLTKVGTVTVPGAVGGEGIAAS